VISPKSIAAIAIGALLTVIMVSGTTFAQTGDRQAIAVVALPGYHVSVFARGTQGRTGPDPIVVDRGHVFVAYQNGTAKDGSDGKSSTVVEYTLDGEMVRSFNIVGHCDGLRVDPQTHLLWALVNNDGNPAMYTIDSKSGDTHKFAFSTAPHGGGYDDVAFHDGMAFISASNPTLNGAGVNVFPALYSVKLQGATAVLAPVLSGNANALDVSTNASVPLNEVDPDSMTVNPAGDVVLSNQAGNELVFVHAAGTPQQSVKRLGVGTQLDDTVWATSREGRLWVVDGAANAIYTITTDFMPGTVYTEAPSDSDVASFVGTVSMTTGTVTPVAIGLKSPTGLLFTTGEDETGDNI
jgi:hypothetical protein